MQCLTGDQREDLVAKKTCSYRGRGFGSQHIYGGLQLSITPVPGNPTSMGTRETCGPVYTCRQNTYMHKIKYIDLNRNFKEKKMSLTYTHREI